MRVRAARYNAPLSGVKAVATIDSQDAVDQSERDRLAEREVEAYGDDDIIDVDYVEDDGDHDGEVGAVREQPELTPPQSRDEFSRDDRIARYQNMMSGYSKA